MGEFTSAFDEDELWEQLARIALDKARPVTNQHVVSRVILKRFAKIDYRGGHFLLDFNLEHGKGKVRGVGGCGKVNDLVRVASASAEALWQQTENILGRVLDTIEDDQLSDPAEIEVAKHAVGLHYLRSPFYQHRLSNAGQRAVVEIYHKDGRYRRHIVRRVRRRTGLIINADDVLLDEWLRYCAENGLDVADVGRARLESQLPKIKQLASQMELDVLRAQGSAEFLIGDAPAIPQVASPAKAGPAVGFLEADQVIMPVSPQSAVRLRRSQILPPPSVDEINLLQIRYAYRNVYYRPDSHLGAFVAEHESDWSGPQGIDTLKWL